MQESGVPNIYGTLGNNTKGFLEWADGAFEVRGWRGTFGSTWTSYADAILNVSRISNQFVNNLNEVRVKSIISNGYIRIF